MGTKKGGLGSFIEFIQAIAVMVVIILFSVGFIGCGEAPEDVSNPNTDNVAATVTVTPTVTTAPTATVTPTATTAPTATVTPTATVAPTATAVPTATTAPTAVPTSTPTPTNTPIPVVYASQGLAAQALGVLIKCENGTSEGFRVDGSTIIFDNLKEDSSYVISGVLNGNIIVDIPENINIELGLSGLKIACTGTCPISVESAGSVDISAKKGTNNSIIDNRDYEVTDENERPYALYAACDMKLKGSGNLTVESLKNKGIGCKNDIKLQKLTLSITAEGNALRAKDNITVESGKYTIVSRTGFGMKTENKEVSSKGNQKGIISLITGEFDITSAKDAFKAAFELNIAPECVVKQNGK